MANLHSIGRGLQGSLIGVLAAVHSLPEAAQVFPRLYKTLGLGIGFYFILVSLTTGYSILFSGLPIR
jgi:hypothetical protein